MNHSLTHNGFSNHQTNKRQPNLRSRQHGRLPIVIISRTHLYHIRPDNRQPPQPVNDSQQFPRRPAARLGGASARSKRRIQYVNVHADVHPRVTDAGLDGGNDPVDPVLVDVPGGDDGEAAPLVVGAVAALDDGRAEAGVDGGVED